MDKFLISKTPKDPDGYTVTPRGKRSHDHHISPVDSSKKAKLNTDMNGILSKNYYTPLANDNGDTFAPTNARHAREPRLPPIILHQELTNPKATYEKIQAWANKPVYFKQVGKFRHIYATHKDDFTKIKEQLKLINFMWTSHNAEDDIHRKLVLKGIDKTYTESDVYDDLKLQFDTVVKVKQLTTKNEDGEHCPIGVYLVYFEWDTILSVPKKVIKYCCFHKITWSNFHSNKSRQIKQCYNCQGFGHHSSNCGLKNRCVKCVDNHSPGKCKKIKGADDAVCCNCGGSHPASYKGCSKAKEYVSNTMKPRKSAIKVKQQVVNGIGFQPKVNRKLTFRDVLQGTKKGTTPRRKTPVNSENGPPKIDQHQRGPPEVSNNFGFCTGDSSEAQSFSFITNEINSLFGISFTELMDTVRTFIPIYKRCDNIAQRKLLLIEFLCKVSP